MACRGVYYAIDPETLSRVLAAKTDSAAVDAVMDVSQTLEPQWRHATDKSWDALHRCLGDGTLAIPKTFAPLPAAVLGGEQLHSGDAWIISLVRPERVRAVADALAKITQEWLRERYDALNPRDYDGDMGDDDFEYTWDWFQGLPDLFERAAHSGRAVVFAVDQ